MCLFGFTSRHPEVMVKPQRSGSPNPDGASPPGCQFLRMPYACPQVVYLKPGSVCMHRRKPSNGLRLRHIHGVAAFDLDDR